MFPSTISQRRRRARSTALLAFLLVAPPLAAQYDGELSENWGAGDGFATWQWSGEVALSTAVATADLLYGVGTYEFPAGISNLHFQAVDRNGEVRGDRSCRDSTPDLGVFTAESAGRTAIVDSSGNLLVGGWVSFLGAESLLRPVLARYEIDQTGCALDETFSEDGLRIFDQSSYCDTEVCLFLDLAEIRPETGAVATPRIVALLRATSAVSTYRYFLYGLTPSGSLDTGFGSSGVREVLFAGLGDLRSGAALEVDAQGRIVVAVTREEPGSSNDLDSYALRYSASGHPDTTFGEGGLLELSDGGVDDASQETVFDLAAAAEPGRYFASVSIGANWIFVDFDAESSESGGGTVPTLASSLVSQGTDRLLWAGERSDVDGFVSRRLILVPDDWQSDLDYGNQPQGYEGYDLDFGGGTGQQIVDLLLWAGRPILVGNVFAADGDSTGFLMRAENAYIFADGFESGTRARWGGY
jgi:hypothetical protein